MTKISAATLVAAATDNMQMPTGELGDLAVSVAQIKANVIADTNVLYISSSGDFENRLFTFNTPDLSATSNYTFVLADTFTKEVRLTKATAITATVPSLPAGSRIAVKRIGAGQVNFVASGVTITPSAGAGVLTDPGQNAIMYLVWTTTTTVDLENGLAGSSGSGDVAGPASSADGEIVLYNGATGKIIKNSSRVLTTAGGNIAALTNPSAITFLRINADNTVTALSADDFKTAIGVWKRVVLSGDVTNDNATPDTLQDVTGLSFPVVANKRFAFRFNFWYTAAVGSTSSRWTINGPTLVSLAYRVIQNDSTSGGTQFTRYGNTYNSGFLGANSFAAVALNFAEMTGIIECSSSASEVIARFSSEISGSAIIAKAGSYVEYVQLN